MQIGKATANFGIMERNHSQGVKGSCASIVKVSVEITIIKLYIISLLSLTMIAIIIRSTISK